MVVRSSRQSEVPIQAGLGGDEFGWMQNITPDEVWKAWSRLPARLAQVKEG